MDSYFEYLKRTFPNFVTVDEIGRSTEGRAIKVIKLHQSGGRADKKAILLDAGKFLMIIIIHLLFLNKTYFNQEFTRENGSLQPLLLT